MDSAGNLFGVTNDGNHGTIFEIAKTNALTPRRRPRFNLHRRERRRLADGR